MAQIQSSKILARYSQGSQEESVVFSSSNRLLIYNRREGKIEISYNEIYAETLKKKISEVIKFYTKFEVFREIFLDICRLKEVVEVEKSNALQYLEQSLNNVDHRIDELKIGIEETNKTEKNIMKQMRLQNRKISSENSSNEVQKLSAIGINSQKVANELINSTRFSDMKEAIEIAKVQEILKIYPENMALLKEQKEFLLGDRKINFDSSIKAFDEFFSQIAEYYQLAGQIGNPLEEIIEYEHEDLNIALS